MASLNFTRKSHQVGNPILYKHGMIMILKRLLLVMRAISRQSNSQLVNHGLALLDEQVAMSLFIVRMRARRMREAKIGQNLLKLDMLMLRV